jgi:hypothetical protein
VSGSPRAVRTRSSPRYCLEPAGGVRRHRPHAPGRSLLRPRSLRVGADGRAGRPRAGSQGGSPQTSHPSSGSACWPRSQRALCSPRSPTP